MFSRHHNSLAECRTTDVHVRRISTDVDVRCTYPCDAPLIDIRLQYAPNQMLAIRCDPASPATGQIRRRRQYRDSRPLPS